MRFQCPFCQGVVAVPNSDMGSDVQCGHCGEIVAVPTSRITTGAVISDFIIQEELGRGGMGVVYLTHQITLDRPAALKVLAGAYANNPGFVVDFIKEARAAAKLNHPHIVQAYAVGEDEGIYFFAMEHIDGETMKDYMKREGVVKVDFALEVIQQIAEALDYAWKEQRLVHRDIKPDNIMLTAKGRAKLADLGLARVAGDIDDADSDEVMGTPQYISPEHLTGAEMDVRSDIYSLGATLFHFITGRFAFEGRTATEIARKHLEEQVVSPRELDPSIPESVCRIIFKMMAKNVNDRYQSAEDLVEDLRMARQGRKPLSATSGSFPKPVLKPGKQFSMRRTGSTHTGSFRKTGSTQTGSFRKSTTTRSFSSSASTKFSMSGTGTNTHTHMDLQQIAEKERKAKKQLIMMLAGVAVVIVISVIFLVVSLSKRNSGQSSKTASGKLVVPHVEVGGGASSKASSQKYLRDAEEVLDFAKKGAGDSTDILKKMVDFFRKYPKASTPEEEAKRAELMAIYVPLDEKRIKVERDKARSAYLKKVRDYQKWLQKKKQHDQEEARREQEEQRLKELEARKLQVLRDKARSDKERLAAYKKEIAKEQDSMRWFSLFYSTRHKYADAKKKFEPALKESSRAAALYKSEAKKITKWGQKMVRQIDTAAEVWKWLLNSGERFKGMQIEIVTGTLAMVQKIENGNITTKTVDKKNITQPLSSLPYKQFKRILVKAAALTGDSDAEFHYLFCDAQFVAAKEFVPNGWSGELEKSAQVYANKKYQVIMSISDSAKRKIELQNLLKSVGRTAFLQAKKVFDRQ